MEPQALPPSITGTPPAGSSPASQPSGNPGAVANAMAQVRQAVSMLQVALPSIPMGSDLHKATVNAISSLSRHAPASEASPGIQQTALKGMAQQAQQQAPYVAMLNSMGGPDAAGMQGENPPMQQ